MGGKLQGQLLFLSHEWSHNGNERDVAEKFVKLCIK